jgi:hypothetical protein
MPTTPPAGPRSSCPGPRWGWGTAVCCQTHAGALWWAQARIHSTAAAHRPITCVSSGRCASKVVARAPARGCPALCWLPSALTSAASALCPSLNHHVPRHQNVDYSVSFHPGDGPGREWWAAAGLGDPNSSPVSRAGVRVLWRPRGSCPIHATCAAAAPEHPFAWCSHDLSAWPRPNIRAGSSSACGTLTTPTASCVSRPSASPTSRP